MSTLLNSLQNSQEEYAKLSYMLLKEDTHRINKTKFSKYKEFVKALSPTDLIDNFKETFEYTCEITISNHMSIPKNLAKLIASFCPVKADTKIYNPCGILDEFAVQMPKTSEYTAQTINHTYFLFNKLRALALGLENTSYLNENMIDHWLPEEASYDFIIGHPPFGYKLSTDERKKLNTKFSKLDAFVLEKCYQSVKQSGKAVCLFPAGILTSSNRNEKKLRKELISSDILETVIMLPNNIFEYTGIKTIIFVLNHDKNHKGMVRFIDASDYFIKKSSRENILKVDAVAERIESNGKESNLIPTDEIAKNDYDLSPARYLLEEIEVDYGEKLLQLRDVLERIKGVSAKFDAQTSEETTLLKIRNLSDDKLNKFSSFEDIKSNDIKKKTPIQIFKTNCLLIARGGGKLKQTYFNYENRPISVANRNISAYSVNTKLIDIEYLLLELDAEYVKKQVQAYYSTRTIMTALVERDFLSIQIKIPSLKEQKSKVIDVKDNFITHVLNEDAADYKTKLREEIFEESASLKHSLLNMLGDIDPNIFLIQKFAERLGIFSEPILEDEEDFTLKDALKSLQDTVASIVDLIEKNNQGLDLEKHELETIGIKNFIKNYIKKISQQKHKFKTDIFDATENGEIFIEANKDLLSILIGNIVKNAEQHAFGDTSRENYKLTFSIRQDDRQDEHYLIIDIADNGKGFPKNVDKEKFIKKYKRYGSSGGTGIGGYDINRIVKFFNGNFELILDDKQFATIYRLEIPIIIN
jgi:type I restriction-modification system DNA methylase subunit/two-component sensor histidine kinase